MIIEIDLFNNKFLLKMTIRYIKLIVDSFPSTLPTRRCDMSRKYILGIFLVILVAFLIQGCGILQKLGLGGESYGEKVDFGNGEEVYYKGDATEQDARKLGAFLRNTGYFDGSGSKSVQIVKDSGTIMIRFVVKDGIWNQESYVSKFKDYGSQISSELYGGQQIEVHLCDTSFNTQKAFVPSVVTKEKELHKPKHLKSKSKGPKKGKKSPTGY